MGVNLQTALRLIYPPRCLICSNLVESDFGLCGKCWGETPFVSGLCCDKCGVPLPGEASIVPEFCDDCMVIARPWHKGRAALLYKDNGRKLVMALKHGDRHEIVRPCAQWLAQAVRPILEPEALFAPVPLHWTRMLKRKFNQSALLASAVAKRVNHPHCPDLMHRTKRTLPLEKMRRDQRFEMLQDAIRINPRQSHRITGRPVILVDDVMTSGATMAACTEACMKAGAKTVSVLILARVAKDV